MVISTTNNVCYKFEKLTWLPYDENELPDTDRRQWISQ